ncbi:c-type cytochrome biogenesis protein CcmI [Marinospirillum perlucidum]|uniref:c-type cytochrome biogenesis protein CcmI n=1 Tax=Marinospirillum perlucidum TaxID=1982602 RepID=UPI000DF2954F|nr:c-type cytochrome biogenesis protein CcmI [Marinospirillum perlucidum]
MTGMWFGFVLLALLACLFLVWPLVRRHSLTLRLEAQQHARQLANIDIYKQKLAQLEKDYQDGLVDEEDYPASKKEIEDLLLDDAGDLSGQQWQPATRALAVGGSFFALALCLAASWWLYTQLGAAPGLQTYYSQQQLIEEGQQDFGNLLRRLEETLEEHPDDVEGWSLLARIYMDMGRMEDAAAALQELIRIQGPNPRLLAQQAQALYFADGNTLTARVQSLIDQARQIDPGEPAILSLLGMAAYQRQQWDEARGYWEEALKRAESSEARQSLREGINDTRQRLGLPLLAASGPSFQVQLSLSEEAQAQVDPQATVFVFARRPEGAGPPLAATRLRVADLPARVELTDALAMSANNNLSSADQVVIQARISLSGQPQAAAGDWQGSSQPLEVAGQREVVVEINQQLQ